MLRFLALPALALATLAAQNLPPEPERQLARDIYKELIELKTGYTSGSTTIAADAMAARRVSRGGMLTRDFVV